MAAKKMGRPTDDPKTHRKSYRLSDDGMNMLKYCMDKTGKSESDIIRLGIEKVYKDIKKKE